MLKLRPRKLIRLSGVALIALSITSGDVALSQAPPFENSESSSVTTGNGQVGEIKEGAGIEVIKGQRDAGREAAKSFEDLWTQMISSDGVYYQAIIPALSPIVGIGFAGWAMLWFWKWRAGQSPPLRQVIHPMAAFMLLANNGALIVGLTLGGRALIQKINTGIFDYQINGLQARAHLKRQNTFIAYNTFLNDLKKECRGEFSDDPEALEQCFKDAQKKAEAYRREISGEADENFFDVAAAAFESEFIAAASGFLNTLTGLFFVFFEWGLAVWALLAPLLVSAHMVPKGRVGMAMLFGGFIAVGTATISYSVLSVATAVYVAKAMAGFPFGYGIISGVINPGISIALGYHGFNAVLQSVPSTVGFAARLFRRRFR